MTPNPTAGRAVLVPGAVAVRDALLAAGVRLVASLPDDRVRSVMEAVDACAELRHVTVSREFEAVAVATGAFLGGLRAVAVMGATGLFTCIGDLGTLNLRHQLPVFILSSRRGEPDDLRVYQEVQGRRLLPVLEAMDFPHRTYARLEELGELPAYYEWGRMQKRPVVCFLGGEIIGR